MKTRVEEVHVPEKRYSVTKYIASDGKEFFYEKDCLEYENRLEIQKHPVIQGAVLNVSTFNDDHSANLYFISDLCDYEFIVEHVICANKYTSLYGDFDVYGPGWYLYWSEFAGDYEYHNIVNLDAYIAELEDDIRFYKNKINTAIESRLKEVDEK